MKTSNKILLGIISIIGLTMLSILIFAKNSLITYENSTIIGDGKIIKVTHNIGEISFFHARHNYEVFVKKGDPIMIIETDENIQAFIRPNINRRNYDAGSNIEKTGMNIGKIDGIELKPTNGIKVYLSVPTLEEITISDIAKMVFQDTLRNDRFKININDSAEADIKIATGQLEVYSQDNSRLTVEGNAGDSNIKSRDYSEVSINTLNAKNVIIDATGHAKLSLSGAGDLLNIIMKDFADVNIQSLASIEATIKAKDQSQIALAVRKKLNVDASDSAQINYSGTPEIVKKISDNASLTLVE